MSLTVTLVGSYPPERLSPPALTHKEVECAIYRAIAQQREAITGKNINYVFVDGQPRSDVVGIFARSLGLSGYNLPYKVSGEIRYNKPITLHDLEIAAKAANDQPLKAHITGPTLMAESCQLTPKAPRRYRNDPPEAPRELVLDFAHALAKEAYHLLASNLPIAYLQIDEPSLVFSTDLTLACEAIEIIAQVAHDAKIPTILHVCQDIGDIMETLLDVQIDILNVEGKYLRELSWLNAERLAKSGKKLAIGCIPVNVSNLPSVRWLERELLFAVDSYGVDNIWGITPECGLRMSDLQFAQSCLHRLVEVADKVAIHFEPQANRRGEEIT